MKQIRVFTFNTTSGSVHYFEDVVNSYLKKLDCEFDINICTSGSLVIYTIIKTIYSD